MTRRIVMVMGVQRSGTTALFRSLARDTEFVAIDEGADPAVYGDDYYLRPEAESRPTLATSARPLLLKALQESNLRRVSDVLDEFAAYDAHVVWIYRDPVNVLHSWMEKGWVGGSYDAVGFAYDWVVRNQRMLRSLPGSRGRIEVVRYEDLVLDANVLSTVSTRLGLRSQNLFRADGGAGRRRLPDATRTFVDEAAGETWRALEVARSVTPRGARSLLSPYARRLRRDAAGLETSPALPPAGPPPSAVSPADRADLRLWLDASSPPPTLDRSLVDARAANGRPAFRFRPSPLRSALGVPGEWRFLSDGSAWTLFIVFRRQTGTTPATRAVLTARAPTGAGFGLYVTDTDRQYWALTVEERPGAEDRGAIVTGMPPPQPQLLDGWRLMVGRHDTGTPDTALTLYSGLTRASTHARSATTSYPRPVAPPSLVVGGAADRRDLDFDGFIAEVVVCGSALDDAARGGITRYLEEKYGLTG